MIKSLLLALFLLGLALLCAFAVRHFGRKFGESETKIRTLFWLFVVGGLVASFFAFKVDWRQRQTTLYEALLEGSATAEEGDPIAVRTVSFPVEHPGVEHTLIVQPKLAFDEEAIAPVSMRLTLVGADGAVFVDEEATFEVRTEGSGRDPGDFSDGRQVWSGASWSFTPQAAATLRLEVGILHAGVHRVFVRVEDPEKRDGVRAPGY